MAHLLGSQFCIESLHSDVGDLQSALTDVLSRSGPVKTPSWKYPDKIASDVDIDELLERYEYSEDEEERQISHIVLLELVVDRLVVLLQAMAKYVEQILAIGRHPSANTQSNSTSIGLVVKKYWNKMVHVYTVLQQLQSENKGKTRKIADLENTVTKLKEEIEQYKNGIIPGHILTSTAPIPEAGETVDLAGTVSSLSTYSISKDEYNKSTQTIETAFVPCESCDRVQKNYREVGDMVMHVCKTQGLPSSLAKYRAQIDDVEWLSANDVAQWTAEQNKDLCRVNKHLEYLMGTIDPLKAELAAAEEKCKKLNSKVADFDKEMNRERQTQSAQMRQYEAKIKDIEKKNVESVNLVKKHNDELQAGKREVEVQLSSLKIELEKQQSMLQELENTKQQLMTKLKDNTTNNTVITGLQQTVQGLQEQLAEATEKLKGSFVTLEKERAKTQSVSKHTELLQGKQGSLVKQIDTLAQENDELRSQVCELEEIKDNLEETLEKTEEEKKSVENQLQSQQALVERITRDKEGLEKSIAGLKDNISQLEAQVQEAKEDQRLLVEYPDLHGPVNPDLKGTGDITTDMENQVKANSIRIQVLEEQNTGLRNSITKMLTRKSRPPNDDQKMSAPVTLWKPAYSVPDTHSQHHGAPQSNGFDDEEADSYPPHPNCPTPSAPPSRTTSAPTQNRKTNDSAPSTRHTDSDYSYSHHALPPRPPKKDKNTTGNADHEVDKERESFVIGQGHKPKRAWKPDNKPKSRPTSAALNTKEIAFMNKSSISAYMQLKRSGMLKTGSPQASRPTSGKTVPPISDRSGYQPQDVYVCSKCDKMYNDKKDLEVHKSYCFGGL